MGGVLRWAPMLGFVALAWSSGAAAMTPAVQCRKAGFPDGHSFREQCLKRVFSERRANFWKNEAPRVLVGGLVGAVAATGGAAVGIISTRPGPGVYRVKSGGRDFNVKVDANTATVRSARMYENVGKDQEQWVQAAQIATGCLIIRPVRDFDALYVWLDCGAAAQVPAPVQTAAPSTTFVAPSTNLPPTQSLADELGKLATLRKQGLLSEAEFQSAKAKLLSGGSK